MKDEIITEMTRCIANWCNGGYASAEVRGVEICSREEFITGYGNEYSPEELLDYCSAEELAEGWYNACNSTSAETIEDKIERLGK